MSDTWKKIVVGGVALCLGLLTGYISGRMTRAKGLHAETIVQTDTIWTQIHDTTFVEVEVERKILRTDTVRLARVDTLTVHDSVTVTVPIEQRTFTGDNYSVTAYGYRVGLSDVRINWPTVTVSERTRFSHWRFGAGVQLGYGLTANGLSPYAGLGISFGYVF